MKRTAVFAASIVGLALMASPSEAQRPNDRNGRQSDRSTVDRDRSARGAYRYNGPARENGFRDGYEKGVEDARDRDRPDPQRHGRYKSASRGYDRDYGSKDRYRSIYRDSFISGYQQGYRVALINDRNRRR
jgi:hypothetical protein